MPTALETMVKILKLERDQGGRNTAVVGGLAAYAASWQEQARQQARRPQHQILIDELVDSLAQYDSLETEDDRLARINYLLDRATNRQPPPQAYRERLPEWEAKMKDQVQQRPERARRSPQRHAQPRQSRSSRSGRQRGYQPYDGASWDEDFTGGPREHQLDLAPLPSLSRPPRQPRPDRSLDEQDALLRTLEEPTTSVNGIGKKFSELLSQLNIDSVRDLLYAFPRDYRDYTQQTCIRDLRPDKVVTVIGTITRVNAVAGAGSGKDLIVRITDGSGPLSIRFFGQQFLSAKLRQGMQLAVQGKVTYFRDMPQMASPKWEELDIGNLRSPGIVPVHRMTKGLPPRRYRRTMQDLLALWAEQMPDPIPESILERTDLADLGWALQQAHFPEGWDHLRHARHRLVFDDLLLLQLAMEAKRREWQSTPGSTLQVDPDLLAQFTNEVFPFSLTQGQRDAIADISRDLQSSLPMNRLLQGDVGAGKTAVAIVALAIAHANNAQSALMAPTSVLAQQHCQVVQDTFAAMPAEDRPVIALLTSALSQTERNEIYAGIKNGTVDIVIGTHALIQEGVEFNDLALAIIDEQQRFGVDQRAILRGKGRNPHLLVMTATPIPRTLALTVRADLDLSVIKEKPAGRRPVTTQIIDPVARERLNGFVLNQLEAGRQAFFVHPLVDESETIDSAAATEAFETLSQVFFRFRVRLLHGQMDAAKKDELMADFAAHKYDVMVTTAVAEVGVDVPNANVIVIDGANRFGLAQLHQFRGRVGRGEHSSHCFLLPDNSAQVDIDRIRSAQNGQLDTAELSIAEQRLSAMETTDDGFKLAELDWRLRGAGELLGRRQSGQSRLHLAELITPDLLVEAQREARTILEADPELALPAHHLLAQQISRRFENSSDLS